MIRTNGFVIPVRREDEHRFGIWMLKDDLRASGFHASKSKLKQQTL